MIRNYIKIGWRNIRKNGFHSFVNVFGLAVGILFTLLIAAYVWSELRVNKTFYNATNQCILQSDWKDPNMGVGITTLAPLAKRLKEDYPNLVANYYRWDGITSVVSKGDKHFRENIQLGDSTLLSMYGFPLLHGNAHMALSQPFSVVITPQIAIKYFGRTDVVGETIAIQSFSGSQHDFLITGVLKEQPENSVTQLNAANNNQLFIPTNTYSYFGRSDFDSWSNTVLPSYIELKPGISPKDLEGPIRRLINENAPEMVKQNLTVHPVALTDYYLQAGNGLVKRMLYTLSVVGVFILLMAVVNFINMAISSASKRMKEIGMRKVMGGRKPQIILQFLTESVIIVLMATILALVAYPLLQSLFGAIVGKAVPSLSAFPWYFVVIPMAFIFVTGIIAGLYPAFVLSSLHSVDALKGKLKTVKERIWLRQSLVGFQFSIAALVMIAAFIVSRQVAYFFNQNLGYNKEYMVASQVPRDWSPAGERKMETVRNEFAAMPQVSNVTLSYEIPNGNNGGQPPVYRAGSDSAYAVAFDALVTDEHYLDTYQIPLKAGGFFDSRGLDSGKVVLNEKAVQALGWKVAQEAVGQQIRIPNDPTVFTIKGVTQDFHFGSMQQKIKPIVFFNVRSVPTYRYLSFRLKPGNIAAAIEAIQKKWATLLPGSSFEYAFMDDTLKKVYASELQLKKSAYAATVLALIIVLLGILGLLSITLQRRTKEMGIRKVLGASTGGLIALFLKEFLPVLFIGGIVCIPVAWYFMQGWLNNYAYRIRLTAVPFAISILILGAVTTVLISIQIAKAAVANPVKSLRTE